MTKQTQKTKKYVRIVDKRRNYFTWTISFEFREPTSSRTGRVLQQLNQRFNNNFIAISRFYARFNVLLHKSTFTIISVIVIGGNKSNNDNNHKNLEYIIIKLSSVRRRGCCCCLCCCCLRDNLPQFTNNLEVRWFSSQFHMNGLE